MLKSNISDVYYAKYLKIKINSHNNLPLVNTLNMHNDVILYNLFLMIIKLIQ